MDVAKTHWMTGKDSFGYPVFAKGKKFLQVSTDEVYGALEKDIPEGTPLAIEDKDISAVLKKRIVEPKTFGSKFFTEGIRKTIKWYLDNQWWVNDVASGDYQKYYEQMYGNR